jgi:hypothetical protein
MGAVKTSVRVLLAALAALAAACSSAPPSPSPEAVAAEWTTVVSEAGDLALALPPWLIAFDTSGAIFANEGMPDGTPGLQLLAEGPRTAELQPASGEALEAWLATRIEAPGSGEPKVESRQLPAGAAVLIRRDDRAGTATAWRRAAWAIRTPDGVAYLLVDGPLDRWAGREAEVERIARLLSVPRPAVAPATP